MKKKSLFVALASAQLLALSASAWAEDYVLTLKNHQFSPKELVIPAGQKVKITVKNQDPTPAEFESRELNREKVVSGNAQISVFVGPLEAGQYPFHDDFHRDTTTGSIVVK